MAWPKQRGNHQRYNDHRENKCQHCARGVYFSQSMLDVMLIQHHMLWHDGQMLNCNDHEARKRMQYQYSLLVHQEMAQQPFRLDPSSIDDSEQDYHDWEEDAFRSIEKVRHNLNQTQGVASCRAHVLAPIHRSEVQCGIVVGMGAFATIFEVDAFQLCKSKFNNSVSGIHADEMKAREILMRTDSNAALSPFQSRRYVMKCVSHNMNLDSTKMLRKAVVGLVCEATILTALHDHPNIIGIHACPKFDPYTAFSTTPSNFFLILDRIQETLDARIATWRCEYLDIHRHLAQTLGSMFVIGRQQREHQQQFQDHHQAKVRKIWQERLQALLELSSGLAYIHDHNVIHRDLKPSNIGFDNQGNLKIFDFGLATVLRPSECSNDNSYTCNDMMDRCRSIVGTPSYRAPEVDRREPYGKAADVYSFGITMWEVLSLSSYGKTTFCHHHHHHHPKQHIDRGWRRRSRAVLPTCPCWPPVLVRLVQQCACANSSQRPTMDVVRLVLQQHFHYNNDDDRIVESDSRRGDTNQCETVKPMTDRKMSVNCGGCSFAESGTTAYTI